MTVRILQVVTSMDVGGIETMLMNLFRNIDRDKIVFDFVVHRDAPGFYDEEIISLGGRIHKMPPLKPSQFFTYLLRFHRFLSENEQYVVVHSHLNQFSFIPLLAAKQRKGLFRIAHSHVSYKGLSNISWRRILYVLACKLGINHVADYRFSCSREAGVWLFGNDAGFEVITNAIDASKYVYNRKSSAEMKSSLGVGDNFVVGHVGNFSEAKNYSFILEVFANLLKEKNDSVLVLIGRNEGDPAINEKIRALGIQDNVILTGVRSDIPVLLGAMDAFLFPSLFEGLGMVLIEAQASGLKCLASDSIPKEVGITDNIEFLSLDKPVEIWVEKLLSYAGGYERENTYQQVVDAGYDIKSNVRWLEDFYMEAVDKIKRSA